MIHFLDVGQGDSILITTRYGKQVLVDGGKYQNLSHTLSDFLPFYERRIDLVIATHPDVDHIGGLVSILERYHVARFLHSGLLAGALPYQTLASVVHRQGIPAHALVSGETIVLDSETSIEVLAPYPDEEALDANEHSIVLLLKYGRTSVLLTGDANVFNEQDLLTFYGEHLRSNILKLGHHGSSTSSSLSFIKQVSPEVAIVSAGCNNHYGHPNDEVVNRVEDLGIEILDTCTQGTISFSSDGIRWVR